MNTASTFISKDRFILCPICANQMIHNIAGYSCYNCAELNQTVEYCNLTDTWTIDGVEYTIEQAERISKLKAFL